MVDYTGIEHLFASLVLVYTHFKIPAILVLEIFFQKIILLMITFFAFDNFLINFEKAWPARILRSGHTF